MFHSNFSILLVHMFIVLSLANNNCDGQEVRCDPNKVMTADACAKCHLHEVQTWKQSRHYRTFQELGRQPAAKEICNKMGIRSVKRSDLCIQCHFTAQNNGSRNKPISGISCESCHGASRDWIGVHNDYGGPTATKKSETEPHRNQRLLESSELGMRNTRDLYSIASSCYNCHTVPNEELVNRGGHTVGAADFEFVAWSQGSIRHNFLRTENQSNAPTTPERLRVMFVVGLIANLEYSTRATGGATEKSKYGVEVANRAARAAVRLYDLQQKMNDQNVEIALEAFAQASLKVNNSNQLNQIADQVRQAGIRFANLNDGTALASIDDYLPDPKFYK